MPTGALDAALHPRAIAVVGAGSGRETIGGLLWGNLVDSRFEGTILPVNRQHAVVQGITAYPDLGACPVRPDLVVVCVPAPAALPVVEQAAALGVPAVCVISAGFAETGTEGASRQEALLAAAASGPGQVRVRVIGPNCTGILGGSAGLRFNATFSRTLPPPGRVALLSQSGAIGLAVLDQADAHGLGIGCFVSTGNSADIGTNDLLDYWAGDPETDVVLLYLESISDAGGFVRAARRAGDRVPIIAVKAGRTAAGRRAAASHTAALAAGDAAVDGVLRQAGVIRAESVAEMLDVARLFVAHGSRPSNANRIGIVTNGGGPGIVAADACERNGLVVPSLAPATEAELRALVPPEAGTANPVDLIASATAPLYGKAVQIVASGATVDTIMVIYNTPLITTAADVAEELLAVQPGLPAGVRLVTVWTNRSGPPEGLDPAGIPTFVTSEDAARALGRSLARAMPPLEPPLDAHVVEAPARAAEVVAAARDRADADGWLAPADAAALLDAAGIARPREWLVGSADEAAEAAQAAGSTVVVKVAAAIHKSDVGGVRRGIDGGAAAAEAVDAIRASLHAAGVASAVAHGFVVQEQIESGVEMLVGIYRDPGLGALALVGFGGTLAELLDDVAVRLVPLTASEAADQVASLRGYPLLTGYRGSAPVDVAALVDVIQRVAAIAATAPEIAELDINPLFVRTVGAVAADVRVRLARRAG